MRIKVLLFAISLLATLSLQAQTNERYIEVTGTSEIEIVPDKIHYLIEVGQGNVEFLGEQKVLPLLPPIVTDFLRPDGILRNSCLGKNSSQSLLYF